MSQIDEATLKNQIKERKFSNAYLIYGNEPYLKQHYANLIAKKCVNADMEGFNLRKFDAENNTPIDELIDSTDTLPAFSEYTCTFMKDFPLDSFYSADKERFESWIKDMPETTVAVFWQDTTDINPKKNAKWKNVISIFTKYGESVCLDKMDRTSLAKTVASGLKKRGITVDKQVAVEFILGGKTCRLGGMAKGSGMIHPNMATTLNFITTDVAISADMIQKALSEIVKITYNCLSIDGDTSTNDTLSVMANGLAGNEEIVTENDDYAIFKKALYIVMECMTMMLASDGEGASKMLECTVSGAPDQDTAIIVAKSIIRSPLTKCAMFGEDANWGRILCAIGYAEADFDIDKVDVDLESEKGIVEVCRNGSGIPFSEEKASEVLSEDDIYINVNLNQGEASAKAWGCDLTYDYVKINGDYRS